MINKIDPITYSQPVYQKQTNERKKEDPLKDFKKSLRNLDVYREIHEIASDLLKITPREFEPQELVNLVFQECFSSQVVPCLDALIHNYPSFTLSPFDQIRRALITDHRHSLTTSWLVEEFRKHKLDNDEEKKSECYDMAFKQNHPYIYPLAPVPISVEGYTLNFLWVNLDPQDRIQDLAQNIFKEGLNLSENAECIKEPSTLRKLEESEQSLEKEELETWKQIKDSFTYRLSKWADVNPGARIHLWYDSALVTQKAQQKTFEMMKEISKSRQVDLRMRDIRQLSEVKDEIENILHPGTHIYYRVDFLKALIAQHLITSSEEKAKYCVVSDIDVEPMAPQQTFDQRTLDYLNSFGYVFNRVGALSFENNFFIFNRENEELRKNHYKIMIKATTSTITSFRRYEKNSNTQMFDSQTVYKRYALLKTKMNEARVEVVDIKRQPRKVVRSPNSQFLYGCNFSRSDYRAETFRFIGECNVPYTMYGRNYGNDGEKKIKSLKSWKAEPLKLSE